MPEINIKLGEEDDRVLSLNVTDRDGRQYDIVLEFLAHHFGDNSDEVQVLIHKPVGKRYSASPNRITFRSQTVWKKENYGGAPGGVWFEFHELPDLPQVTNKERT